MVEFDKYTARKPFVEEPKNYSCKPCKKFSTQQNSDKPHLKSPLALYMRDRQLWNPSKEINSKQLTNVL